MQYSKIVGTFNGSTTKYSNPKKLESQNTQDWNNINQKKSKAP